MAEITPASREQAQGIEQVNKAVTDLDKVVQQNASGAEESASASEELNAQAQQMKSMVLELVALVGGATNQRRTVPAIARWGKGRSWVVARPVCTNRLSWPRPLRIQPARRRATEQKRLVPKRSYLWKTSSKANI